MVIVDSDVRIVPVSNKLPIAVAIHVATKYVQLVGGHLYLCFDLLVIETQVYVELSAYISPTKLQGIVRKEQLDNLFDFELGMEKKIFPDDLYMCVSKANAGARYVLEQVLPLIADELELKCKNKYLLYVGV